MQKSQIALALAITGAVSTTVWLANSGYNEQAVSKSSNKTSTATQQQQSASTTHKEPATNSDIEVLVNETSAALNQPVLSDQDSNKITELRQQLGEFEQSPTTETTEERIARLRTRLETLK